MMTDRAMQGPGVYGGLNERKRIDKTGCMDTSGYERPTGFVCRLEQRIKVLHCKKGNKQSHILLGGKMNELSIDWNMVSVLDCVFLLSNNKGYIDGDSKTIRVMI